MMKIGVIDIETTGLDPDYDQILEIGIVQYNTKKQRFKTLYDSVIKEDDDFDRDAWIFSNSTLTPDEVDDAPPLYSEQYEIQEIIDSLDAVTAYNKEFDFGFLKNRGFKIKKKKQLGCLMLAMTGICKIPGSKGGYKWPKAEEAYIHITGNKNYVEKHRGAADAMDEAKIMQWLLQNYPGKI